MRTNDLGILLIIGALFGLWLYNTGRAASVLAAVKGAPPTPSGGATAAGGQATAQASAAAQSLCSAAGLPSSICQTLTSQITSAIQQATAPVGVNYIPGVSQSADCIASGFDPIICGLGSATDQSSSTSGGSTDWLSGALGDVGSIAGALSFLS